MDRAHHLGQPVKRLCLLASAGSAGASGERPGRHPAVRPRRDAARHDARAEGHRSAGAHSRAAAEAALVALLPARDDGRGDLQVRTTRPSMSPGVEPPPVDATCPLGRWQLLALRPHGTLFACACSCTAAPSSAISRTRATSPTSRRPAASGPATSACGCSPRAGRGPTTLPPTTTARRPTRCAVHRARYLAR